MKTFQEHWDRFINANPKNKEIFSQADQTLAEMFFVYGELVGLRNAVDKVGNYAQQAVANAAS